MNVSVLHHARIENQGLTAQVPDEDNTVNVMLEIAW